MTKLPTVALARLHGLIPSVWAKRTTSACAAMQGTGLADGNRAKMARPSTGAILAYHPRDQRVDAVGRLQGRKRHRRVDAGALAIRRQYRVLEHAGETPRNDMSGAQIGLGEDGKNRIVGFAAGEIDLPHQPAQEPRRIDADAAIAPLEAEARDRKADAAFLRLVDGAVEIAPERLVRKQPGVGVDHALGIERFEHAPQPLPESVHAHERHETLDEA